MAKVKSSPKHYPGKFRTHLAQAVKHLELAKAEHAKLVSDEAAALEVTRCLDCAEGDTDECFRFYLALRPTLPGYIEVTERDEEGGE